MQWRQRKAKLGSNRIQACKAGISSARPSMRQPDLRWGQDLAQPPRESPSQDPAADQHPMCAAIAMMHGIPSGAASSWQGAACPPIHEHRPWTPPAMQEEAILPNPGYRVAANLWHLDTMERAHTPGPMASFLRHVSTMQSPDFPSYASFPQPAEDIRDLRKEASLENRAELRRYLEKLQFESTTLRMWYSGLQDEMMDEAQKVPIYMMRMIAEPQKTTGPQAQGWLQQWQARATQPPPPPASVQGPASGQAAAPAQSASASTIPVKPAPSAKSPMSSNPGMANAPRNAPFPSDPSADPWTMHKPRHQWSFEAKYASPQSCQPKSESKKQYRETSKTQVSFAFRMCRRHKALEGGVSCVYRVISILPWSECSLDTLRYSPTLPRRQQIFWPVFIVISSDFAHSVIILCVFFPVIRQMCKISVFQKLCAKVGFFKIPFSWKIWTLLVHYNWRGVQHVLVFLLLKEKITKTILIGIYGFGFCCPKIAALWPLSGFQNLVCWNPNCIAFLGARFLGQVVNTFLDKNLRHGKFWLIIDKFVFWSFGASCFLLFLFFLRV